MIALMPAVMDARSAAMRDRIDAGTGTSAILIYSGLRPETTGNPTTGTMLVQVDLPYPCGAVAGGELQLDTPAWVNVLATGDCAWARVVDRDGTAILDMDVGLTGSGADMEVNTLTVYAGGLLGIVAAVLRE